MSQSLEHFSLSQGLGMNFPNSLEKCLKNDTVYHRNLEDDSPLMRFATGITEGQEAMDDFIFDSSYVLELKAQEGNKKSKKVPNFHDSSLEYLR